MRAYTHTHTNTTSVKSESVGMKKSLIEKYDLTKPVKVYSGLSFDMQFSFKAISTVTPVR